MRASSAPSNARHCLLGQSGGGDLRFQAIVIRLVVGPGVLGQISDVLDVLGAVRAVIEGVVPHAAVDAGVVGECCVISKHTDMSLSPYKDFLCCYRYLIAV